MYGRSMHDSSEPPTQPLPERVNGNIKAEVGRHTVTWITVAQHLNLSRSAVSDRQSGRKEWALSEVDSLAKLLGVDREVLLR